ncbi:UNVERIFIED_CONTAM: Retrovirus-related Pol polyprotein from transposon TNT 1-94 [Sesamum latifolium]|uniref:Retrovirus-related Pol polyprotein from transposon TNT 1-94 n=1 Tax=Sesamum latifolium TaxID=2727402 RepID=A0AAW2VWA5_9LAMI
MLLRYTEGGQAPGPFAKFLAEQGIVAQYTMPGSPDQNGVAERRNRTLLDMVRSMMASSKLPKSLWIEALKTAVYILNRVPTKAVSKTSFELFKVHNTPTVQTRVEKSIQTVPQVDDHEPVDPVVPHIPKNVEQPVGQQAPPENVDTTLRRSTRIKRSPIPSDYMVYLQESEFNVGAKNDPETFSQAMISRESNLWYDAMKEEMNSMAFNQVWDLVELPDGFKAIGCKWVFKTKKDSLGNIERHKARLVAKGFTQREGIDYTDTFSPVSKKDSLRTIMALVAHFDMDLHQMDVKTAFLNGELEEEVYMEQPEGFSSSNGEHLVCKLKKSIYGLKQASRQWYLKFHDVISSFGFVENIMDQCIYQKNFEMKEMGEASYVIGVKIHRDRSRCILGLSQETYINKVLERFQMKDCSPGVAPIVKGDKLYLNQCPRNDLEREQMKDIPYASAIGSLMYAQVCTRPDIAFAVGMLGRFQSNPSLDHWRAAKKVMRYLQGTKDYMLMYRRTENLEVVGYSDLDFAGCVDSRKSTSGYIFMIASGAATSHGVWLKSFISGLRIMDSISRPLRRYSDNSAAVFMAKNNKSGSQSKYIDIKYLATRERVKEGKVVIEHISTELMLADPLTKGMPLKNSYVTYVYYVYRKHHKS